MKRCLVLFFAIFLILPISCKKSGERKEVSPYSIEEDIDSIPLVVVTDKQIEILDLKTLEPFGAYQQNLKDFIKTVVLGNEIFIICEKNIYWMNFGEEKFRKVPLPFKSKGVSTSNSNIILYGDKSVFEFAKDARLSKLTDFKKSISEIYSLPDYSSIITVFTDDETCRLSKFSLLSKKEEREIEIRNLLRMEISPFGKRIYALTKNNLLFLDTKDLNIISKIPFKADGVDFVVTASENKVFVFTKNSAKIITIKRTLLKITSEMDLEEQVVQNVITGDGGTIFFISQDTLFRFDTGSNGIVEKIFQEKKSDILLSTQKGSRVIKGRKGGSFIEIVDGNTLAPIKEIALDAKLLDIVCGKEPFRKEFEEPSYTDTINPDTVSKDTIKNKPQELESIYFTLQVSSSSIREGALKLKSKIKKFGVPVYIDSSETKEGHKIYRVKIGAFETRSDAQNFKIGIKSTYDLSSWISKDVVKPTFLKEAGIDISGDKNGEILLYDGKQMLLFTNYNGIQKTVFKKSIEGVQLRGRPISFKEENKTILGVSFTEDSVLAIKWIDNNFEVVKRKFLK